MKKKDMKKSNLLYLLIRVICLLPLLSIHSCKKDVLDSRELLVYMTGEYGSINNTVTVPFVHTPVAVTGNAIVKIPAYATRQVPADIDVTIISDTSLVSQYNKQNLTNYLTIPADAYKLVNPGKHTIKAGSMVSDTLQVQITNAAELTDPKGYLLPLSIQSLDSRDQGAQISTTRRTVFLNVTYAFTNITDSITLMTGTTVARTSWVVTVSNSNNGNPAGSMTDGNNSTAWRSSNSSTAVKSVTVDLGSVQTFKALVLTPNYVNVNENITQMTVSISQDNVTWIGQGIWTGTIPASSSSAATPDKKGVNFIIPVQARYFRLDITGSNGQNRVGIGELNVLQ